MREAIALRDQKGDTLRDERGDRFPADNGQELPYPNWQANDSNQQRQMTSNSAPASLHRPLHLNCWAAGFTDG